MLVEYLQRQRIHVHRCLFFFFFTLTPSYPAEVQTLSTCQVWNESTLHSLRFSPYKNKKNPLILSAGTAPGMRGADRRRAQVPSDRGREKTAGKLSRYLSTKVALNEDKRSQSCPALLTEAWAPLLKSLRVLGWDLDQLLAPIPFLMPSWGPGTPCDAGPYAGCVSLESRTNRDGHLSSHQYSSGSGKHNEKTKHLVPLLHSNDINFPLPIVSINNASLLTMKLHSGRYPGDECLVFLPFCLNVSVHQQML